jgi:hypothetical protein
MVHNFHPIYYIMANAVATFPLLSVSEDDTPASFLKRARALAKGENVSLLQYVAGMLRHALRGDNLTNVHFYQDGSGDTYNTDDLDRMHEETLADKAAGRTITCNSKEEMDALFEQWKKESDERIKNGNKVPA